MQNDVMMQLFVTGPVWDGNLVSKRQRDDLMDAGLIDRNNSGWQWLNAAGVEAALAADVKGWADQRWYRKQNLG